MKVQIKPGETIRIEFEGTDGAFEISFDSKRFPMSIVVLEAFGSKDSYGRGGVLYKENFDLPEGHACGGLP